MYAFYLLKLKNNLILSEISVSRVSSYEIIDLNTSFQYKLTLVYLFCVEINIYVVFTKPIKLKEALFLF